MDGLHRMIVSGRNCELSRTALQDAAGVAQPEPGMEIYTAYLHARHAGEYLLKAHTLRARDRDAADHCHTEAMHYIDQLAETLGLELVPRTDVVTR